MIAKLRFQPPVI